MSLGARELAAAIACLHPYAAVTVEIAQVSVVETEPVRSLR